MERESGREREREREQNLTKQNQTKWNKKWKLHSIWWHFMAFVYVYTNA